MCLGVFLLGFILPGTLCTSRTSLTISFPMLGKFSATVSSNIFSGPFSLFSSECYNVSLVCLMLSQSTPVTLAWRIPRMGESGRLQSMGSLGVRHDWANLLSLFTFVHWRGRWQLTPVFLLENPRDRGAWWAAVYGVSQSRTWLKWLSSSSSSSSPFNEKYFFFFFFWY